MNSIYEISVKKTNEEEVSLSLYKGKVLLIVNTATRCGLAPQFEELEELWNTYSHDDFMILGFPCNQFMNQEPESNETVEESCKIHFGVTFPLFAKIDVNGFNTHPLYDFLKKEKGGFISNDIKWNFTKFLIDREGTIIERYAPTTPPRSIREDIEKYINKNPC